MSVATTGWSVPAKLQEQLRRFESAGRKKIGVSTGIAALDGWLPAKGLRPGTLVEWLAGSGSGAESLVFRIARHICQTGAMVVLDLRGDLYPPALCGLGVDLNRTIILQPASQKDGLWALDQSLRCDGVSACVAWLPSLDDRTFRRLQLSAESGRSIGLLLRPTHAAGEPSWADLRVLVQPVPPIPVNHEQQHRDGRLLAVRPGFRRRLKLELLRSRGGQVGRTLNLVMP